MDVKKIRSPPGHASEGLTASRRTWPYSAIRIRRVQDDQDRLFCSCNINKEQTDS